MKNRFLRPFCRFCLPYRVFSSFFARSFADPETTKRSRLPKQAACFWKSPKIQLETLRFFWLYNPCAGKGGSAAQGEERFCIVYRIFRPSCASLRRFSSFTRGRSTYARRDPEVLLRRYVPCARSRFSYTKRSALAILFKWILSFLESGEFHFHFFAPFS